jgi:hypothetical protein
MSNIIPLFPPGLSIKYVYEVVDELADAALKDLGGEECRPEHFVHPIACRSFSEPNNSHGCV